MDNKRINNLALLFISTLLSAIAQLLLKYAFNIQTSLIMWMVAGIAAYVVSTLIYLMVLSRTHLSWSYGIGGLSYIFATIFAATILMENIPVLRWLGVGVIFLGVVLIGMS